MWFLLIKVSKFIHVNSVVYNCEVNECAQSANDDYKTYRLVYTTMDHVINGIVGKLEKAH